MFAQNVERVDDGRRNVLIMEIWRGHKPQCAHRHERHWEPCRPEEEGGEDWWGESEPEEEEESEDEQEPGE